MLKLKHAGDLNYREKRMNVRTSSNEAGDAERLLAADHAELDQLLRSLFIAFKKRDIEAIVLRLDLFWARLAMHVRAEHKHLFPSIIESVGTGHAANQLQQSIIALREDHDFFMHELAAAIALARHLQDTKTDLGKELIGLRRVILNVRRRLEKHNDLEESIVYPATQKLLGLEQQSLLAGEIRRELSVLPKRFRSD